MNSGFQRVLSETLGTAALLAAVVGSGIMGDRLSGGSVGLALLANTIATGAILVVLILALAPVSGAHLNPAVTVVEAASGRLPWRLVPAYLASQVLGGIGGVLLAHLMFDEVTLQLSTRARSGPSQMLSEAVATFGLVLVIGALLKHRASAIPFAVGAYITSAYWFTASTSFANPAVTIARAFTDTFSGIRPGDVPGFLAAQAVGALLAVIVVRLLFAPGPSAETEPS